MEERRIFELEDGWTRLTWPDMLLEGRPAFTAKKYAIPAAGEITRDIRSKRVRPASDLEVLAALTTDRGRIFRSFIVFSATGPTETRRVLFGERFQIGLHNAPLILGEEERYPIDNIQKHFPEITNLERNDIWIKPTGWWIYDKSVAYLWAGVTTWPVR